VLPTKSTPMPKKFLRLFPRVWPIALSGFLILINSGRVAAQDNRVYTPLPLPPSNEVADALTDRDIPLGDGGFARDYAIQLASGEQVVIELTSDNFDTVLTLLTKEGKTVGKNDDGPDGSSNSLLFARIKKTGPYTVRVQGFSDTSGGKFSLKVSRLKAVP
jgi:Bacterial pre-peptidase C-terminal domain